MHLACNVRPDVRSRFASWVHGPCKEAPRSAIDIRLGDSQRSARCFFAIGCLLRIMSFTKTSLTALVLGLSSLLSQARAAPSPSNGPGKSVKDPYSSNHWPAPRKITGQDLNGTLGGVHIHDPSIVLGPDDHYYAFSSHGLATTSRASKKNSLEGYWEVVGQVLTPPGSIDDPAKANRLW